MVVFMRGSIGMIGRKVLGCSLGPMAGGTRETGWMASKKEKAGILTRRRVSKERPNGKQAGG